LAVRVRGSKRVSPLFDAVHDLPHHAGDARLVLEAHCIRRLGAADHAVETAAGRADPQVAMPVDVQSVDRVVAETVRIFVVASVVMKAPGLAIEQIQAATRRADPQIAARILGNRAGTRIAECVDTAERIADHRAAVAGDTCETAAERSDPQIALAIFVERHHAVGRERLRIAFDALIRTRSASHGIEALQPSGHRADPQRAVTIEQQRHDAVVTQPKLLIVAPVTPLAAGARVDLDEAG
jgi:hypothetical protein